MDIDHTKQPHPLENGQMWKLEYGYLQIVELGKRLVHYRILRQLHQHAVTTRLIGVVELLTYLRHSEANLMNERNQLGDCLKSIHNENRHKTITEFRTWADLENA